MTYQRALEILSEEFDAANCPKPSLLESGILMNGIRSEVAEVETEETFREQCRRWIESANGLPAGPSALFYPPTKKNNKRKTKK